MEHPEHVLWWISPPEYESLTVQGLVDELPGYIKRSLQQMRGTKCRGRVHVDPEIPADVCERARNIDWPESEFSQYLRRRCAGILVRSADLGEPALAVGIVTDLELQHRLRLTERIKAFQTWIELEEQP